MQKIKIAAYDAANKRLITEENSGLSSGQILDMWDDCRLFVRTGTDDIDAYEGSLVECLLKETSPEFSVKGIINYDGNCAFRAMTSNANVLLPPMSECQYFHVIKQC